MAIVHVLTDTGGSIYEDGPVQYGVSYRVEGEGAARVWVLLANKPLKKDWIPALCERLAREAAEAGVRVAPIPPFTGVLQASHAAVLAPAGHAAPLRPAQPVVARPPKPPVETVTVAGKALPVQVITSDRSVTLRCGGAEAYLSKLQHTPDEWTVALGGDGETRLALFGKLLDHAGAQSMRLTTTSLEVAKLLMSDARASRLRSGREAVEEIEAPKDIVRFCRLFDRIPNHPRVGAIFFRTSHDRAVGEWQVAPEASSHRGVTKLYAPLTLATMAAIRTARGGRIEVLRFEEPVEPTSGHG
ncbi:MAG: hypothetical protein U0271_00685 [Polyangiaceae bacterium]